MIARSFVGVAFAPSSPPPPPRPPAQSDRGRRTPPETRENHSARCPARPNRFSASGSSTAQCSHRRYYTVFTPVHTTVGWANKKIQFIQIRDIRRHRIESIDRRRCTPPRRVIRR
jgi:hypothetical protein